MKRVVTIQDISCVGKCSLTVALPIISAMGMETAVIPTAVLSTHTAFGRFTFKDLTDQIEPICNHWAEEKFDFDAVYTGYLGSFEQLRLMSEFFDRFRTDDNLIFVDPVMGDNGSLYAGFTQEFADEMAKLCSKADVIVPNMTEASFMLHEEYRESGYDEKYVHGLLVELTGLGAKSAVITGVCLGDGRLGAIGYDSVKNEYFSAFNEKINARFHGTGDVFASVCVGAMMNGMTLKDAASLAADFTSEAIKATVDDPDRRWYGVNFESKIAWLLKRLADYRKD